MTRKIIIVAFTALAVAALASSAHASAFGQHRCDRGFWLHPVWASRDASCGFARNAANTYYRRCFDQGYCVVRVCSPLRHHWYRTEFSWHGASMVAHIIGLWTVEVDFPVGVE